MYIIPLLIALAEILVYPGLIFSVVFGGIIVWMYRKVRARLEGRRGPPWYQTYADVFKLLIKETIIPWRAWKIGFVAAPMISLAALFSAILLLPFFGKESALGFLGDAIVLLYLLTVPTFAIIFGGMSSGSPYGIVGSGREASLLVWYELPLWLSAATVFALANSISVSGVVEEQALHGPFAIRLPLAFIAFLIAAQAKLAKRPFDIPHAETEIVAGPYTEYSGSLRALFELSEVFKWLAVSALAATLFLGWPLIGNIVADALIFIGKIVLFALIFAFIDVINPRLRIEQAGWPLWKIAATLALIDAIRVCAGLVF